MGEKTGAMRISLRDQEAAWHLRLRVPSCTGTLTMRKGHLPAWEDGTLGLGSLQAHLGNLAGVSLDAFSCPSNLLSALGTAVCLYPGSTLPQPLVQSGS